MKKLICSIKRFFCKHDPVTIRQYNTSARKVQCFKCGSKWAINLDFKAALPLDDKQEKEWDKEMQRIHNLFKRHS